MTSVYIRATMNWHLKISMTVAAAFIAAVPAAAQTPPASATLTGIIRDSTGAPISNVEVLLTETSRGTRTDDAGKFTLGDVSPGAYRVWFRRLGYSSSQFDWAARVGQRTEVAVTMTPIAKPLDPVVVFEKEAKEMNDRASILGLVIDSAGAPIDEAEVQLVGANRSGLTRANGGFLFRPLAVGPYVLRVRKLGYEPSVVKLNLLAGDDREVVIRMRQIPTRLDPVVITERSGYNPRDAQIYDDLESRMRWKSFKSPIFGPEDLAKFRGLGLDETMKLLLLERSAVRGYPAPAVMAAQRQQQAMSAIDRAEAAAKARLDEAERMGCILLNGKTVLYQPLRSIAISDIDLLEVYPTFTEYTGTIADRFFNRKECRARSTLEHPTYYVVWLKGNSK